VHSAPKILQKNYPARPDIDESTLDRNSSLSLMLQMVGRHKDVLDVGCATGYLAKLISMHDCSVMGIEVNAEAAEDARAHCSRVFVADLDIASLPAVVEGTTFDVMVFGDVLEHLREPARLLEEARDLIRADGYIVISIPNIAHGAIRLALLDGAFDYAGMGILDETHLKFFTLKTLKELLIQTGYELRRVERTKVPIFDHPDGLIPSLSRSNFNEEVVADIESDAEFDTLQFVVQAFPLTGEERLRATTRYFVSTNTELAAAQKRTERLSTQVEQRNRELEETKQQLLAATAEMVLAQESFRNLAATDQVERGDRAERELTAANERLELASIRLEKTREQFSAEIQRVNHVHDELSSRLLERQARIEQLEQDVRVASSQRGISAAEIVRLNAELEDVRERYLVQTEGLIDRARRESQQLSTLIDVVQTSTFWRLKRFLARLAGR
jgi:2-polyprenyl-3-methyl-5-hydroxy-6-metoxy-1,4-benzoquinol methylase